MKIKHMGSFGDKFVFFDQKHQETGSSGNIANLGENSSLKSSLNVFLNSLT